MTKRKKIGLAPSGFAIVVYAIVAILGLSVSGCAQNSSYVIAASNVAADPGAAAALPAATTDADEPVLTIKKRVDEVNVLFIATDRHGKFVRNLNQSDFSIFDDHKPVQSILNFRRETDLPIELGLLMDVSGSVQGRFGFEKEAATGFLQHVIRHGYDRAFVVGFNKESHLTQDFTDQVPLLAAGVQRLNNGGGTALYDAIYKACKEKLLRENSDHPIRKAIVILSDGEDNQSEYTRAQAIEMAQRAEVLIYAISTDDSGLILRGDKVLEDLASATGGRAFFPYKMKDITRSFAAIEEELRSQYAVSYKPSDFDADGRYHSIEITALKKDLQVRARRGYYAPRQ
ncbi:MAG TPA: VWA domain-containing protein [Terriglobales bacterium]|nr:VWA domain-containing protein [Terriglobales bacterium]